jgi:hypothetical protein
MIDLIRLIPIKPLSLNGPAPPRDGESASFDDTLRELTRGSGESEPHDKPVRTAQAGPSNTPVSGRKRTLESEAPRQAGEPQPGPNGASARAPQLITVSEKPAAAPAVPAEPLPLPEASGSEAALQIDPIEFDIRKFEFSTESLPFIQPESRPQAKLRLLSDVHAPADAAAIAPAHFAQRLVPAEQVHSVTIPDLPPRTLSVHRVSMEVGEGDSQIRIVIHQRNGDVSVRLDAATDGLRRDLEASAGSLLQALQREQLHVSDLDFSSYGSATDSEQESNRRAPKKSLKPEALFADKDETYQSAARIALDNPSQINS